MAPMTCTRAAALAAAALLLPAVSVNGLYGTVKQMTEGAEIISDITAPVSDEFSALQIKAEQFWKPMLEAAEGAKMDRHLELYADADAAIKALPEENVYVREALTEALAHLKRADEAARDQALQSSRVAKEKLDAPCDFGSGGFSFLRGGQSFIKAAVNRFVGGRYSAKLEDHVGQRQAAVLPVLRGTASVTGGLLGDCRLASKRGFDVRKYDIYNRGVPKTPESAKAIADRIIEAAGETRRSFTKSITGIVQGITKDTQDKQEEASATVTRASLKGLHAKIAEAEARLSSSSAGAASQLIDL